VHDIAPLVQLVLVLGAVATPAVLLARVIQGDERGSLSHLFRAPDHTAWPRGVQEEEPTPWVLPAPAAG